MRFASAISEHPDVRQAAGEVVGELLERVGAQPELAVLFVTAAHRDAMADVADVVRRLLAPGTLVGAAASSVVGGDREVEEAPAVVLWAGRLGTAVTPIHLDSVRAPEGTVFTGLTPAFDAEPGSHLVLLVDPFSFPADDFVDMAADRLPNLRVIGGLASAANGPGGNRLVLDDEIHTEGAVGVLLPPGSGATTVVSQGCRPIGSPMVVTKAEHRVVLELAGKPALERLAELVGGMTDSERDLARRGLHVGWVIDEHKDRFERGDFLIRNLLGGNKEAGALVVGGPVEVGATVQFQVRDAATADEDLRQLLAGREADGALLFTCTGRGSHLFGRAGHDAELVDGLTAGGATAGMFCAGEVGPVGARSFVHGFTASVLLLGGAG
jgi:small ligand-binding sensory domain FIST